MLENIKNEIIHLSNIILMLYIIFMYIGKKNKYNRHLFFAIVVNKYVFTSSL